MRTMSIAPHDLTWLEECALVDADCVVRDVRLHVGGPPTWYLRMVKKSAITLGDHVWFVSEAKRNDLALLAHELVHVGQYRSMGKVRFLFCYVWDLAKAGFRYSRRLPLEMPAYARQEQAKRLLPADR